jgi:hypothetical protein
MGSSKEKARIMKRKKRNTEKKEEILMRSPWQSAPFSFPRPIHYVHAQPSPLVRPLRPRRQSLVAPRTPRSRAALRNLTCQKGPPRAEKGPVGAGAAREGKNMQEKNQQT